MAAYTVRQECDERTGEYRENEAGEDRDPLHLGGAAQPEAQPAKPKAEHTAKGGAQSAKGAIDQHLLPE